MTEDGLPAEGERPTQNAGGRRRPGVYGLARSGFIEYDRVLFFSDAVFAIAITVLAVNLHPSVAASDHAVNLARMLARHVPTLVAFGVSFAVIGLFWLGHHSMFRYIIAFDRTLTMLNLLFLGAIAFLPYPTEVISDVSITDPAAPVIFYAACVSIAGLAEAGVWHYAASKPDLTDPAAARVHRFFSLRILRVPVIFLASIPVALVAPQAATYLWALVWVLGIIINRMAPNPGQTDRHR